MLPSSSQEPIAVCGLSLRFPQDATSEQSFWAMLLEKRSAMTEFPPDRLNVDAFHHLTRRGGLRSRGAHFLSEDLGVFDAGFFSLTPSEAAAMDPTHRILLETTYLALENAGYRLEDLAGSQTSVHTGCFTSDYLQQMLKDSQRIPPYAAVGATQSMLANRVSWFFDLRGPSFNLDSACSSSAVAVDASCRLLRSGETNLGIVAGCNLLLDPDFGTILSDMQMLSPDSRCFAFDHRANGYSRGEGVGVVVLKRLSDALRDNDVIRAIIRSSGVNQDGRTAGGITQPDGKAHARLIRETYERAGLSMAHTRFFEAHGTGTALGDPTEMGAISACFDHHRTALDPLYVGSVKTNIGHLEGASGIAGLIKAILVVESGVIPPNANFESINRRLAPYDHMMKLPTSCVAWPPSEVRRASINSFGYGGTNAHIVIDDVASYLRRRGVVTPSMASKQAITEHDYPKLLVWSASSESSMAATISAWQTYCHTLLEKDGVPPISDMAYTLDTRRSSLHWTSYAVASSPPDLSSLETLASSPVGRPKQGPPRLAFVFTGQGAQWFSMGRELLAYQAFSESLARSEEILRSLGCSWSLKDELMKSEGSSAMDRADIAQPMTAVLQIALVDLLTSVGVRPVAVVGHSMGEISAAYCAEFLTQESCVRIAYYRGLLTARIVETNQTRGAMLSVGLSADEVSPYLRTISPPSSVVPLVVSCVNSPRNVTIGGDECAIEQLKQHLDDEGIFARRLRVPVAYHSSQMRQIVSECLTHFGCLESPVPGAATADNPIQMVSSVTGAKLTRQRACEASYWTDNLVSPVLFAEAITQLCKDSSDALRPKLDGSHRQALVVDALVEVGPHAALQLPIQETLETMARGQDLSYLSVLYRRKSASYTFMQLIGQLHCRGVPVHLRRVNEPQQDAQTNKKRNLLHDAPGYVFDHSMRYWSESPLVERYRLREHGQVALLGQPAWDWNPLEPQWRCYVQIADIPWVLDHKLNGRAVYPASAFIVMVMQGLAQVVEKDLQVTGFTFRRVSYESPIAVTSELRDLETRLGLKPSKSKPSTWSFVVHSVTAGHWTGNCTGTVTVHYATDSKKRSASYRRTLEERTACCNSSSSTVYDRLAASGFHYGPSFQGITQLNHNGLDTVRATLSLGEALGQQNPTDSFVIHPGTLDAFLHLALVSPVTEDRIPTQAISRIDKLWVSAEGLSLPHQHIAASARSEGKTARTRMYSGFAMTDDGADLRLAMEGLETTIIASAEEPNHHDNAATPNFLCTVHTAIDVETLSGHEVTEWLASVCGPDPTGPQNFFVDLRRHLNTEARRVWDSVQKTGIDDTKPHLKKYLGWMEWFLSSKQQPPLTSDEDDEKQVCHRLANYGFLGNFFLKMADHVLDVLQGRSDMMQLVFEDNLLGTFYEQALIDSPCCEKLKTYLEALSFKNPDMTILEIGAGTGSFTEHILDALSISNKDVQRFNRYVYTDISGAFFSRARDRFTPYAHKMNFGLLDISQDPLDQGYEEHMFDIITASNVLHVTSHVGVTLRRLRKLLKPGGKLLFHEYIIPHRVEVGFVFGLLPGWWPEGAAQADEGRTFSPLLSETAWDQVLRDSGFVNGADFVLRDYADDESHTMSIICATATDDGFRTEHDSPKVAIAVEPDSAAQAAMRDSLSSRLRAEGYVTKNVDLDSWGADTDTEPLETVITLFDLESAILSRLDQQSFHALKRLLLSCPKILWVSRGGGHAPDPSHGLIHGLSSVFRIENINSRLATLELDPVSSGCTDGRFIMTAFQNLLKTNSALDQQPEDYMVQNGMLRVRRIAENTELEMSIADTMLKERRVSSTVQEARPFTLSFEDSQEARITKTQLSSDELAHDEVEVQVCAVGLNSIDVSIMSGENFSMALGRELAGTVTRAGSSCDVSPGDRICAYRASGDELVSTVRVKSQYVAKVDAELDFISSDQLATLPQDYIVAEYLVKESRIQPEDIVVIRGGDTRLGRATLSLMKRHTSRLCTAISQASENGNDAVFSGVQIINEDNFVESFKTVFPEGAQIVLDFVGTPDILELAECVSPFGQILCLRQGSTLTSTPTSVPLFELPASISFRLVDVAEVLRHQTDRLTMPNLSHLEATSLFPTRGVDLASIDTVLTLARQLEPQERLAIVYDDDTQIQAYQPSPKKDLFDSQSTYVISGGLGDLGQFIATWMASRGARHLILLSRSGPKSESAKRTIQHLEDTGVRIYTPICDVADPVALETTLSSLCDVPRIKGCVHAAGALKDVMYENMTFDDWTVAVDPKARGSWNLHQLLPGDMDFFIMTSSISGVMGQATQTNYASGNTYQDALAKYRLEKGQKAVSLDLGLLSTAGMLSQNDKLLGRLAAENIYMMLSEYDIQSLLEYFCHPGLPIERIPSQVVSGIVNPSFRQGHLPVTFSHPFWSQTLTTNPGNENSTETKAEMNNNSSSLSLLMAETSSAQMGELVADALAEQICVLVLASRASVSLEEPFHAAGADSLSAVHLRNWILKQFSVDVAVFDILGDMSIMALGNFIASEWRAARSRLSDCSSTCSI